MLAQKCALSSSMSNGRVPFGPSGISIFHGTRIKGGCGISGLYELAPLPYTFVQSSLQLTWDQVLRNSPILHLPYVAAPLLISYGGQEPGEFRRQSDDFLAELVARVLPLVKRP